MEHKLITGGEIWLPFARSRIKALKATGLVYASQQFEIDGASVKVRIVPGHEYITLSGGLSGYQFFSTGPTIQADVAGFGLPIYYGYATKANSKGAAKPLASSLQASLPPPAKQWSFVAPPEAITASFERKNLWQIEGIAQHAFYPQIVSKPDVNGNTTAALDPKTLLISSWSSADPLQSLALLGGKPFNRSRFDITYDAAPGLFIGNADTPLGFNGLAPDADWYKRACLRRVTHPLYGARTFIVMSDVFGTFHAYPTGQTDDALLAPADALYPGQAIKTNVPEKFVKRLVAPWPAWCRRPSVAARDFFTGSNDYEYLRRVPQYRWAFNSAATRACSVVFEDLPALALNDSLATKPWRTDAGVKRDLQESLPGLLELAIDLELTGPNPEDFRFDLTVAQALQPTVSQQYVMMADYAWDVPDAANADMPHAALDDLIVMVGGIYHTSALRTSTTQYLNIDALKSIIEVKNQTQGRTVRTFLTADTNRVYANTSALWALLDTTADKFKDASAVLLAVDLRILAFVVQQRYVEQYFVVSSAGTNQFTQAALRVKTYAYNVLEDEIALEEGTPLDTTLVAMHASTSVAGLFKLALNEVGAFYGSSVSGRGPKYMKAYDVLTTPMLFNPLASFYSGASDLINAHGGNFQASAFLYAERMATALQLSHHDRFAVHPNGSWSVATAPFFYYSGPVRVGTFADPLNPSLMKQGFVDIVCFRTGTAEMRQAHLDLFNKAFDKTLTAADFSCTFTLFNDQLNWVDSNDGVPGKTIRMHMVATTPSGAALSVFLGGYSVRLSGVNGSEGVRFHVDADSFLSTADARVLSKIVFSAPPLITGFVGSLVDGHSHQVVLSEPEFSPFPDHTAVLNGSTLFY